MFRTVVFLVILSWLADAAIRQPRRTGSGRSENMRMLVRLLEDPAVEALKEKEVR